MSFNPIDHSTQLDQLMVLAQPSPGISTVEGSSAAPRKWEERGGYGLTGATLVFTGMGLAKFDQVISLYNREDWVAWDKWLKVVAAPPVGKRPRVLDVSHPWLEMFNVFKAAVLDNSLPRQTEDGLWQIVYNWQAFRAPKFTLAKPEGAKATPADPVDAQLDANTALISAQFAALAKQ